MDVAQEGRRHGTEGVPRPLDDGGHPGRRGLVPGQPDDGEEDQRDAAALGHTAQGTPQPPQLRREQQAHGYREPQQPQGEAHRRRAGETGRQGDAQSAHNGEDLEERGPCTGGRRRHAEFVGQNARQPGGHPVVGERLPGEPEGQGCRDPPRRELAGRTTRARRGDGSGNEGRPPADGDHPDRGGRHCEDTARGNRGPPAQQLGQRRGHHGGEEGTDIERRGVGAHRRALPGRGEVPPDDQRDHDVADRDGDAKDHGAQHDQGAPAGRADHDAQEHAEQGQRDGELGAQLASGQRGQRRGQGKAQDRDPGQESQFHRREPEVVLHLRDHRRHGHQRTTHVQRDEPDREHEEPAARCPGEVAHEVGRCPADGQKYGFISPIAITGPCRTCGI